MLTRSCKWQRRILTKVNRRLMNPIEESVESMLMWEGIKKYLHKLTQKECEVMISL